MQHHALCIRTQLKTCPRAGVRVIRSFPPSGGSISPGSYDQAAVESSTPAPACFRQVRLPWAALRIYAVATRVAALDFWNGLPHACLLEFHPESGWLPPHLLFYQPLGCSHSHLDFSSNLPIFPFCHYSIPNFLFFLR